MDLFPDSDYEVELEKELSLKKQYLDVVIIRKTLGNPLAEVPAGLGQLAERHLLTYKSSREPLDELVARRVYKRSVIHLDISNSCDV